VDIYLYKKYDLSFSGAENLMKLPESFALYSGDEAQKYYTLVLICHDLVISYLESNPEASNKWGQSGYRYYDILKLASPLFSQKVLDWSKDNERRKKEYEERTKNWGIKYKPLLYE
jgi:hypothetical protein